MTCLIPVHLGDIILRLGRIDDLQPLIEQQQQKQSAELAEQQKSEAKTSEEATTPAAPKLPNRKITSYGMFLL